MTATPKPTPTTTTAESVAYSGFRTTAFLGGVSSAIFVVGYVVAGAHTAAIATACGGGAFFLARRFVPERHVTAGVMCLTVVALVGVVAVAHDLGGLSAPPLFWLPLLVRATYLAVGRRVAVASGVLTSVAVVVIVLWPGELVVSPFVFDIIRVAAFVLTLVVAILGAAANERARERTASSLAQARDEAMAASRVKSELVAAVSHELRTPLHAIVGMTGLLLDTKLDDAQRDYTRTVRGAAESLVVLVDDLLEASKLDAGRVTLTPAPFDLRALAEPVVRMLSPRAAEKRVALVLDAPGDLPRVVGDVVRLRQVLTNLVDNAIKFTPAGGHVDVKIDADTPVDEVINVKIGVADTGIGIPSHKLPVIFERFRQADSSTTRRYGGTGLGLAIAKDLLGLMGGSLAVASTEGQGSTFTAEVKLPRQPPGPKLEGTRVLLAEDNVVNEKLAVHLLQSLGCSVDVARNGAQAVSMAAAARYDVILMDCHMPEMDGYRAAAAIRAAGNGPPILALTAAGSPDDVKRAHDAGMDALLQKPIDVEGIRISLGRVVRPA